MYVWIYIYIYLLYVHWALSAAKTQVTTFVLSLNASRVDTCYMMYDICIPFSQW